MLNLFNLMAVLCTIFLYQSAFASTVSEFDELVSLYDSKMCKECHSDISPEWKHSSHAQSVINPKMIKAVNFKMDKSDQTNMSAYVRKCFSCHAPQISSASDSLTDHIAELILIAANDTSAEKKNKAQVKLSRLNLNCRVCHMMKGKPDNGAASNTIWGPGWDEHEQSHKEEYGFDTLKSAYITSASFCKSCHYGYDHQLDRPEIAISQVKCVANDVAAKNCQDCHIEIDHSFSMGKPPAN